MKTTDLQEELFYLVDENDSVIGSIGRSESLRSPDKIHRAIEVLIFDNQGKVLIQQRSATKDTDPLSFSLSTGGHVTFGEDYFTTVVREVKEEVGITVPLDKLKLVGKLHVKEEVEQEIDAIFECHLDERPKIKIRPEEVENCYWMSLQEIKDLIKNAPEKWTQVAVMAINSYY